MSAIDFDMNFMPVANPKSDGTAWPANSSFSDTWNNSEYGLKEERVLTPYRSDLRTYRVKPSTEIWADTRNRSRSESLTRLNCAQSLPC